jgi:hypothetical protein
MRTVWRGKWTSGIGRRYPLRREIKRASVCLHFLVCFEVHYILASTFGASHTYEPWDMNDYGANVLMETLLTLSRFIVSRFESKK